MYGRYLLLGVCLVLLGDSLDAKQNRDHQKNDQSGNFLESNSAAKPSEMINIDDNPPQSDVYMGSGDQVLDDDYSGAGVDDEDSEGSAGPNTDDEDAENGSGAGMYKSPCQKLKAKLETHQVVGAFTPHCTDDGAFEKMQCFGSTGECWCVNEMGREIEGTKLQAGSGKPDCSISDVIGTVHRNPVQAKPAEPVEPEPLPSEPEEEVKDNSVEQEDIKNSLDNMPGLEPSVEIATVPPETNEVEMLESKGGNLIRSNVVMTQPGILAGIVGGAVVGLLCAVLLVMFIVYRMRKKDEGSYALDEPKRSPSLHTYSRATNREFYA